jgi:hypothetical protein
MATPNVTMETRAAAEAVYFLWQTFSPSDAPRSLQQWVDALEKKWPDLSASLFTAARDE